jgi:hypothetical protein
LIAPLHSTTKAILATSTGFVTRAPESSSNTTLVRVSRPGLQTLSAFPFKWRPERPTHVFQCPRPGRFPARSSCTEYHVCRRRGGRLLHSEERCPPGHGFSSRLKFCVPSHLLLECKAYRTSDDRVPSKTPGDTVMKWLHKKITEQGRRRGWMGSRLG